MFSILGLFVWTGGRGKGKKKDSEKYWNTFTASVQEEGLVKCNESCWIIEGKGNRIGKSNRWGLTEYSTWLNTMAKPLWTMNVHLKDEGQECKTCSLWRSILVGEIGWMERAK
jgi:hypothetical protein